MRKYWLASVPVVALLIAGCGSSDSAGGANNSDVAIGKTEFVKQANAICAASKRKLFAAAKAESKELGREYDNVVAVESALIPTLESEVAEIRQLGAPAGDEEEIEAILAEIGKVVAESKQDPETIATSSFPYKKIEDSANKYGLTSCPLD